MSDLSERKLLELKQKLLALDHEFERWLSASEPGKPAQKNNSQVRAITASLTGLRDRIHQRVDALAGTPEVLAEAANLQRLILAVYRVWEFFRAKLEQRGVPVFKDYLAAADELIWTCYEPLRKLVYPDLTLVPGKEPPLVFLNGGWSPFVGHREAAFQAEDVSREFINDRTVKRILESQPIPVVGVPWYQVAHLPDALVLLHETGHLVEADFGLSGQLQRLLDDALRESDGMSRRSCWAKWLPEVFADLFGCLSGGPTYADTLVDFLASSRPVIETERSTEQNDYPSTYLRILLAAAALDKLDFKEDAARIKSEWRSGYPNHAMVEFEPDVTAIAASILPGCTIAGRKLVDEVAFTRAMQESARSAYGDLALGDALAQPDIRVLFATARLAYNGDPQAYARGAWDKILLDKITASLKSETRAGEEPLDTGKARVRKALLERVGADLFDELVHVE